MLRTTLVITFLCLITTLNAQNLDHSSIENGYLDAISLFEKQKFKASALRFDQLLEEAEDNNLRIKISYYSALCAIYNQSNEGEALMRDFVQSNPNHPNALLAYYDLGNFYFEKKKYKSASLYYQKVEVVSLSEEQKQKYYFQYGFSDYSLKKYNEALSSLNLAKRTTSEYQYNAAYYAGYIAYQKKDFDNALLDMKAALKSEEYASVVPYIIASIYYNLGKLEKLELFCEEYKSKEKKAKKKNQMFLLLGELYYKKSNFNNANINYDIATSISSKNLDRKVKFRMAHAKFKVNELEGSQKLFKSLAVSKDSIAYFSSYYLGNIYLTQNNKQYAKTAFEKVKNSKFENKITEESAFLAGKINFDLSNYQQAILSFTKFIKEFPESENEQEAKEYIAKSYLNTNDYRSAIQYLENSTLRTTKLKAAYQNLGFRYGVSLFNKGKFRKSIIAFNKGNRYPIDKAIETEINLWIGEAFSVLKKYEKAKPYYLRVLRSNDSKSIWKRKSEYGLAYAFYYGDRFDLALPYFKSYVENLTNESERFNYDDALMRLADCYYVNKTYAFAQKYYDLVIEQDNPDKDYAFFQKGMISGIESKTPAMQYAFGKVLEFQPRSSYYDDALYQMAKFNADAGNYKLSGSNLSKLISESPESELVPFALENRAIANFNLKNYDSVIEDYAKILKEYSSSSNVNNALLGLQEALALTDRNDELAEYMALYKQSNPDNNHLQKVSFEASKQYYYSQNYQKSIQEFSNFLIENPESPFDVEVKYYLADSYYRLKDKANAAKYFEYVVADGKSHFVNRALSKLLLIQSSESNHQLVVESSKQLEKRARNKKDLYKSWSAMMKSYYHLQKFDSVTVYADLIIEKANVSTNAHNLANLYLGKAAYGLNKNEEAMDLFLQTINSAKDVNGAEAQYLLADLFYNDKKYEQSIETLMDLSKNFSAYEYWLTKAFILIAQNYIMMEETFQAKATLESVIEKSPVQSLVRQATSILEELELKVSKEEALPDSVDGITNNEPVEEKTIPADSLK